MNARILIKIGGRAFEGEQGFKELAGAIKSSHGLELIIVHGGGAEISQALNDAKRETKFIDGIRLTRAEDIRIVEDVLSGTVNRRIASWLSGNGVECRQMSGKTENLFLVEPLTRGGLNWGYVGKIKQVNAAIVLQNLKENRVPVISPVSGDKMGESYNVNADSAAAALAAAAGCTDLVFITDVPGVMVHEEIRPSLTVNEAQSLMADGLIKGGMVAKMESAFEALNKKVPRVHIIQWQGADTLKNIVNRQSAFGTVILS
ncbi:N-acetylglutamate kinase (EC [Olavius sp. associated proteobacterium Delta 1]|nr:N-acetylglutamate kinase (EC [Olavius sp. associated proteobacterium Delta 1]